MMPARKLRRTPTPGHPIVQCFEPGQDWRWCYVDGALLLGELRYEDGKRRCSGPEAGKAEALQQIGGRATERNVTLLFGAKDAEHKKRADALAS